MEDHPKIANLTDDPNFQASVQNAKDCLLRPARPKFPWLTILILLIFAFIMIYAGQKIETLRYENKLLQNELNSLKSDDNDKR